MKRALVLAGGGSKGAYEVGFVKALHELGIEYHIVTGTSIGALNGCLLAQNDFDAMETIVESNGCATCVCRWICKIPIFNLTLIKLKVNLILQCLF